MLEVVRKIRGGRVIMTETTMAGDVRVVVVADSGMQIGQDINVRKPRVDPFTKKLVTATVNYFSGTKNVTELETILKALEVALDEAKRLNEEAFVSADEGVKA